MRKLLRFVTSRGFITFVLLGLQVTLFIWFFVWASLATTIVDWSLRIVSYLMVLWIIGRPISRSYKLIWCVAILVFPVFGGMFYLFFGEKVPTYPQTKRLAKILRRTRDLTPQDDKALAALQTNDPDAASGANYLANAANAPLYRNTATRYLPSGAEKLEALLADIAQAKRFIFLEYFIIEPGAMWDAVLDALVKKAQEGVEVRVMFDDIGCLMRTPRGYDRHLRELGIQVETFNKITPQPSLMGNNRDHRKIAVIDGLVAYTGGINLADEYIGAAHPFGAACEFKDSAVRIEGEAVWSFTVMFLQMWELEHARRTKGSDVDDYEAYRADPDALAACSGAGASGYVAPYGDSPLDNEAVGENVYLNMIASAHEYLYVTTPYLIIDDEMTQALCRAVKRGVDVRVLTPHIPDKKPTFLVTRAHYPQLLANGVRVYEYTPGFLHSKLMVADGRVATVGTVNMDYRSFYLHFECGAWMYGCDAVEQVADDVTAMMERSEELTVERHYQPRFFLVRMLQAVLRVIAPIL